MRSWMLNAVALGFGCMLALLVAEGVLQLYNPFEVRIKGDTIVLPADRRYRFEQTSLPALDAEIVHTKNTLGFRGPEPPSDGLGNYLSIIVVGGSTTECFYLSDGKDWPAQLHNKLSSSFNRLWINNAGLDGHSTIGHTVLIQDHIAERRPRLVLFLVGLNDQGRLTDYDHTASHFKGALRLGSLEGFVKSASAYSEVAALSLNVYRYFRARSLGIPHEKRDLLHGGTVPYAQDYVTQLLKQHESALTAFADRLRHLVHTTRKAGIDPVLITQPALFGDDLDPDTGVDLATVNVQGEAARTRWEVLQAYNAVTKKVAAQEDAFVIDLANTLEKRSSYYYDFVHFTNAGAERVATIIHRDLQPYLAEKYSIFLKTELD